MNASQLASTMLEWEQRKIELDLLTNMIESAVLDIGKTQTVGNVRATFRNGRKKYDYERGAKDYPGTNDTIIEEYTVHPETPLPYVEWKKVCAHVGCAIPFEQGDPGVTVKLI